MLPCHHVTMSMSPGHHVHVTMSPCHVRIMLLYKCILDWNGNHHRSSPQAVGVSPQAVGVSPQAVGVNKTSAIRQTVFNMPHCSIYIYNPEPDVPKGKPNGAMRSKFHHSKRLQFVVNNAASCVFHRYANRPIHR